VTSDFRDRGSLKVPGLGQEGRREILRQLACTWHGNYDAGI